MADDEGQPALTAEEGEQRATPDGWFEIRDGTVVFNADDEYHAHRVQNPHALAALCLYGQPFGFTRDGLKALRLMMEYAEEYLDEYAITRLAPLEFDKAM